MTNEMMRPCTLWGETFDAMRVKIVEIYMATSSEPFQVWVEIWEENPDGTTPITHKKCFSENEIIIANREAITTIADALNAPVLATEVVMKDLPKDAKLRTGDHSLERNDKGEWGYYDFNEYWEDEGDFWVFVPIDASDRIFSDRCSKTAEYLRQFTLKGKRIKQKEMN
jgi:hypothetical protein